LDLFEEKAMKRGCSIQTPLGEMIALSEQDRLCGLSFVGQKYAPEVGGEWLEDPANALFSSLRGQLGEYFSGQLRTFDLPLTPVGTEFQLAVWELLLTIPAGVTTTYGTLARRVAGQRGGRIPSAQAVGGAVGRNPIAIIIPCHRVIGADGSLTGYAGGLDRKAALLKLENGICLTQAG
jgi:methylated-DNA-[protein]-cysteine S-methyltransferase